MGRIKDINTFQELHNQSMDLAEGAFQLKKAFKDVEAKNKFEEALTKAKQAFSFIQEYYECEPTRSLIACNIASLALNCNQYREAERYACIGLMGNPPDGISEDLREVLRSILKFMVVDGGLYEEKEEVKQWTQKNS